MEVRSTCRIISDIILVVVVGYLSFRLEAIEPLYKQGFFCDDRSLTYPYKKSTVSVVTVYIISCVIPGFGLSILALRDLPFHLAYRFITSLSFGGFLNYLVINLIKLHYGALRPHFFEICRPDWSTIDCSKFVTEFNCTRTTEKDIYYMESWRSFPSSHAGVSVYGMLLIVFYVQERYINRDRYQNLIWPSVQGLAVYWASFASVSRIRDHKHHPHDVVAGILIAAVHAYFAVYKWSDIKLKPQEHVVYQNGPANIHIPENGPINRNGPTQLNGPTKLNKGD